MGFFKKIFQKGETAALEATSQMPEKIKSDAITTINLRKETLNKVCLTKTELQDLTSKVVVVLDYSGSMDQLYRDGVVQETLNRLLPLALRFDDDGEMELYIFSNNCKQLAPLNINNFIFICIETISISYKYNECRHIAFLIINYIVYSW